MTFKVLFVCSANVCRSPSAALLFAKALLGTRAFADVAVYSAGTDAVSGEARCTYCRRHIDASRPELEPLASARSRAATAKRVEMADLVLCADRDAVGKVLRANPRARPTVFTMIEASTLATRIVAELSGEHGQLSGVSGLKGGSGIDRLVWLAGEMDAARGQIPLSEPGRLSRMLRRTVEDPTEILDVHASGDRAHRAMLRQVTGATSALARAILAVHRETRIPTGSSTGT